MDEIKRGALNAIGAALVAVAIWYLYRSTTAGRADRAGELETAAVGVC